jgi:hypothetical protein
MMVFASAGWANKAKSIQLDVKKMSYFFLLSILGYLRMKKGEIKRPGPQRRDLN